MCVCVCVLVCLCAFMFVCVFVWVVEVGDSFRNIVGMTERVVSEFIRFRVVLLVLRQGHGLLPQIPSTPYSLSLSIYIYIYIYILLEWSRVGWWGNSEKCNAGALGNAEYPFITIAPRSTLATSSST